MAPVLKISKGKPIRFTIRLREGETRATLAPMGLTGKTVRIKVRPTVAALDTNATPLLLFTTADGTITTEDDADYSYIHVEFDDVTEETGTANEALADAVWDFEITGSDGVPVVHPVSGDRYQVEFVRVVTD